MTTEQQATPNYFKELAGVNVRDFVDEKKFKWKDKAGNVKQAAFTYLPWASAVEQLLRRHPDATWEEVRFPDPTTGAAVPYLKTETGYFVEVAVTVNGIRRSKLHPVLDDKNNPIAQPNAFDINASMMRCLVKAIALHGLGLYIYAGEDKPAYEDDEVQEEKPEKTKPSKLAAAIGSGLSEEERAKMIQMYKKGVLDAKTLPELVEVFSSGQAWLRKNAPEEVSRFVDMKDAKKDALEKSGSVAQ